MKKYYLLFSLLVAIALVKFTNVELIAVDGTKLIGPVFIDGAPFTPTANYGYTIPLNALNLSGAGISVGSSVDNFGIPACINYATTANGASARNIPLSKDTGATGWVVYCRFAIPNINTNDNFHTDMYLDTFFVTNAESGAAVNVTYISPLINSNGFSGTSPYYTWTNSLVPPVGTVAAYVTLGRLNSGDSTNIVSLIEMTVKPMP